MKIEKKLLMALGAMLATTIAIGIVSAAYLRYLATASENVLADNYKSLEYSKEMLSTLDKSSPDKEMLSELRRNFSLQSRNITESSEGSATFSLGAKIDELEKSPANAGLRASIRSDLYRIADLNMAAISAKGKYVTQSAYNALLIISTVCLFCFFAGIVILYKVPKILLKPFDELKRGISDISRNRNARIDLGATEEFREIADSFNLMAEKIAEYRKSSMGDLLVSKKRVDAVINSLHDPIIGLDAQKNILFINDEAVSILNISKNELVGKNAMEIALSNDLMRRLAIGMGKNKDKGKSGEPIQIYADNKESYFQIDDIPLNVDLEGNGKKSFIGNVIILNNITKFKELDNAKTNFISTISHEMKTPISSITMSIKLLEDSRVGNLSQEQKELVDGIKENSDRLLGITGELLKMTQLETGKLKITPKLTRPIDMIHYAVSATKILAERFKCNVEVEYPDKMPDLFVDGEKIAWVITNLLSNAIHHSPENSRIIVGALERGKNVEIYVKDFGKGIDPRYHKSIFERYFRVPGAKVQGSGLGLAISKDFLEVHNGDIQLESELGKGSTFIIKIPYI